ncbi:iron ABC transporter permease [Acuticoccus sp. M5D2P5]|uniref:ABC transporter permease n=1 Tax=Acuticoccus kalidii TaxID=2910977 RepID=UPI001F22AA20|nr:iron ABC transporter permease [Acuticoccus kalidii]MCF3936543.1 iron ABC transporter permease [Acuticoccus kalidii]
MKRQSFKVLPDQKSAGIRAHDASRSLGGGSWLTGFALVLCALTLLPLGALIVTAFHQSDAGAFGHYASTVLPRYVANTLALTITVGVAVTLMGVSSAWLVTMCRFPGRWLFSWALVLPLAVPGYVSAYAYTYLLQHPGPVQTALRDITGWGPRDYWFPDIRSLEGAAFVLAMVLYPYVYLLARTAFLQQSATAFEASRTLGRSPWRAFIGVAVPLARPAIVAGLVLAMMETLADYGTVFQFGVETFTTAIYRTWFSMGDRIAAVQLALILVSFILLLIAMEKIGRRGQRFSDTRASRPMPALVLTGWRAGLATLACALPIAFGFLIPAVTLFGVGLSLDVPWFDPRTTRLVSNTVILASVGAVVTVAVAMVIAYARRISRGRITQALGHLAGFGYAVPGAVIAVGLLIPFGAFDQWINRVTVALFGVQVGLLLTGTIAALVFAYVVRFLAVSLNGVEAGLTRIPPSLDGAARTLGSGPTGTFLRIHAPLLRGGLLTAFLITFVDIMKELPATLILRPFNFDTLAIRASRLASDERLAEAAVPSLMIVLVGLLPVILLSRQIARSQQKRPAGRRLFALASFREEEAASVTDDEDGDGTGAAGDRLQKAAIA